MLNTHCERQKLDSVLKVSMSDALQKFLAVPHSELGFKLPNPLNGMIYALTRVAV